MRDALMAQLSFSSFFYFVLCSLNRYVGFAELRMRLNNKNKISFILYCVRLSLTLATPKVLSLDNKNEKSDFHFVLCSLNRTFALKFENC